MSFISIDVTDIRKVGKLVDILEVPIKKKKTKDKDMIGMNFLSIFEDGSFSATDKYLGLAGDLIELGVSETLVEQLRGFSVPYYTLDKLKKVKTNENVLVNRKKHELVVDNEIFSIYPIVRDKIIFGKHKILIPDLNSVWKGVTKNKNKYTKFSFNPEFIARLASCIPNDITEKGMVFEFPNNLKDSEYPIRAVKVRTNKKSSFTGFLMPLDVK